jgi:hypothetical protein
MAVDRDVGEIGQQLGRAVLPLAELEQLRRRVDEARRVAVVEKVGCVMISFEEGQVGATPRMRNSRSARSMRAIASSASAPRR